MFKHFIFLFILVLFIAGCKTHPPTSTPGSILEYGRLIITSNVDSVEIIIDNISTGKFTPDSIIISVGEHLVKLQKDEYVPESKLVRIYKDSSTTANFNLKLAIAKKIVLIEDFANVSCTPCVTSNKILETVKANYGAKKVLVIKYPTNFPSPSDPFYLANTTDCNARMSFYNILVAPTTKVDGMLTPTSTDSNSVKEKIEQRITQTPKFKITVADSLASSNYFVNIKLETIDTSGVDFANLVLHTAVIETLIEYSTPPGSNGETKFHDVMRKMLPSNAGESIVYSPTGTQNYSRQISLNAAWNSSKLECIAFIQNKITKEILQAGSTIIN